MFSLYYKSPLDIITIIEQNAKIVEISFGKECKAELIETPTPLLENAKKQLEEYFAGKRKYFDLPIAPKGTNFQLKVWNELVQIKYGTTKSYKDIAKAIGNPLAYRAVGHAIHKNPIEIVVPCHRVVGCSGKLTGYASGIDIKKKLLELENL